VSSYPTSSNGGARLSAFIIQMRRITHAKMAEIKNRNVERAVIGPFGRQKMPDAQARQAKDAEKRYDGTNSEEQVPSGSIVIPGALLEFNQSPTSCLRVVDVFGYPGNTNGVCDLLHLVVHAGS
jgi:hypothetical protein